MLPELLLNLISDFRNLTGVTKKQAEKMVYNLLKKDKSNFETFISNLDLINKNIHLCQECFYFTENDICEICKDKSRQKILVVVETQLDVLKFEESKLIRPFYHILGGLMKVDKEDNSSFHNLNIEKLLKRTSNYSEIILALSPNLEGIVTSNILKKMINHNKITQLAHGIPIGAALDYVDDITLKIAFDNRKESK